MAQACSRGREGIERQREPSGLGTPACELAHDCEATMNISQALLELLQAGKLPSDKDIAVLQELLEEAQHQDSAHLLQALHATTSAQPDVEENIMYGLGSWSRQLERLSTVNGDGVLGSPFQRHANTPLGHDQDAPVEDILTALLNKHSAFDPPAIQGTPLPLTAAANPVHRERKTGSSLHVRRRAPLARSTTFSHPVLTQEQIAQLARQPPMSSHRQASDSTPSSTICTERSSLATDRSLSSPSGFAGAKQGLLQPQLSGFSHQLSTASSGAFMTSDDWSARLWKVSEELKRTLLRIPSPPSTAHSREAFVWDSAEAFAVQSSQGGGGSGDLKNGPSGIQPLDHAQNRQGLQSMTQAKVLAGEGGERLWLLPSRSAEPRQLCCGMQQAEDAGADDAALRAPLITAYLTEAYPGPRPPPREKVDSLLTQALSCFNFDAFAFNEATDGHPLSVLGFFLLHKSGLMSTFNMHPTKLARFLRKIEAGYRTSVPYHNAIHAADVLQTLHAICTLGGLSQVAAEPLLVLGGYLAAIIHDHEHEGVTNAFHISTGSSLAMCYNDVSPLENHHLSSSFNVIREYDFMPTMSKAEFVSLRKVIVDLVLSTDMAKHLKIVGRISALAAMVSASRQQQASKAMGPSSPTLSLQRKSLSFTRKPSSCDMQPQEPRLSRANTLRRPFDLERVSEGSMCSSKSDGLVPLELDEAKKILLLQVALKCADLGHVAETVDVHLNWVRRLEEEFFQQGDLEKASGLPVSPLFDREHAGVSKSQEGFLSFVASPLFQALVTVLPDAQPLMTGIEDNIRHWKAKEDEQDRQP
eukprot:CAMPEP_0202344636 /NCGR_PEP_ID=MMETSP1126-20121109/4232_1 /ASSEMBLY_ACC=CAM_ASM_000457 /TAXON_ID=3047 /ORGANISM="Dunaliella tertiolecta, Strain CCMP1320" /LENGTH=812 /DNA_ID=CAMNT_0048935853 /DNA_START=261 /DNA_END=2699 /DNA_ORIENTATION=+